MEKGRLDYNSKVGGYDDNLQVGDFGILTTWGNMKKLGVKLDSGDEAGNLRFFFPNELKPIDDGGFKRGDRVRINESSGISPFCVEVGDTGIVKERSWDRVNRWRVKL